MLRTNSIEDDLPVVLASPVALEAEWRFFLVDRQIVDCSEYRRWGQYTSTGSVPHAAIDLAANIASEWSLSGVYCLDLGKTEDRIGIEEANCFKA